MAKKQTPKKQETIVVTEGSKGILIIAMKHWKYGEMAANLAMSIKFKENIPIALYCDDIALQTLSKEHIALFDYVIPCENSEGPFAQKLMVNDISPFETTILLDADMLAFPQQKISPLFDLVDDEFPITYQNRGYVELGKADNKSSIWCDASAIADAYKLPVEARLYSLHSEVVIWKKCEKVDAFFKEAKAAFDNPKIDTTKFAGGVADEFGYIIAVAMLGQYPHKDNWICSYWVNTETKPRTVTMLYDKYHFMSMGGNTMPQNEIAQYNNLAKHYASKLGISQHFIYKNKRNYLRERNTI